MTLPRRRTTIRAAGRTLFLTDDASALRRQLEGETLTLTPRPEDLLDAISTDEITPAWACYHYDEALARYAYVGLRGGDVEVDAVARGGFAIVVSGRSKGCGSSRETAPYAEREAGIRVVVARSFEKIYRQNCHNIGLVTTTDFSLLEPLARGERVPLSRFTAGLDPISRDVVHYGGLFAYNRARLTGDVAPPELAQRPRPMTLAEKIIARHAVLDADAGDVGAVAVAPGESLFLRADVRFSHEYVTPMAEALYRAGVGDDTPLHDPASIYAFRDHLTLVDRVMDARHVAMGLDAKAKKLEVVQRDWARRRGVRLFGEVKRGGQTVGSEAICHNKVVEELARPGDVVVGTDSHTCMAGSIGAFAFGVGATDMANAWFTGDVRACVPASVRIELTGRLRWGVTAKDVMLHLLAQPYWRNGEGIGKVLEFAGEGLRHLRLDERSTLTNMAVEAGGFTGIVEADDAVIEELCALRGEDAAGLRAGIVRADPDATYAHHFVVALDEVVPMVATPGDPRNGVPLDDLAAVAGGPVAIDIAYGGSCTGGKRADMDMYHQVLAQALAAGRRIAPGVRLYLQFGSQEIRAYARERGYIATFERIGAELVDPSCGACIRAGPGVSESSDQVTVSAINRNYPGRSGPGRVYLANPYVVAASALAGVIVGPAPRETHVTETQRPPRALRAAPGR
ncbi:MAG: aconitase family protein [Myxococcota bacterium]